VAISSSILSIFHLLIGRSEDLEGAIRISAIPADAHFAKVPSIREADAIHYGGTNAPRPNRQAPHLATLDQIPRVVSGAIVGPDEPVDHDLPRMGGYKRDIADLSKLVMGTEQRDGEPRVRGSRTDYVTICGLVMVAVDATPRIMRGPVWPVVIVSTPLSRKM
jgi:hypothetical protein